MVANRLNLSFVIWRKEIREILLDRRTLFAAVISPLFITPMLILLSGFFIQNQTKKQEQAVYKVGIVNQAVSPEITQFIKANPTLTIVMGSRPELEKEVVSHSVKAVIILPDNINQALKSNKTASIDILYDPGNDVSSAAAGHSTLTRLLRRELAQRLCICLRCSSPMF
jgi:sodium transport system permease protein